MDGCTHHNWCGVRKSDVMRRHPAYTNRSVSSVSI